jgi:prepilin-type N-terminal cleavage/methylation domain-containing protein
MQKNKGFTLIELLVVIAIIGILASVVLASLNSARAKGADAAVKSNLANIRAQAEIVYDGATPNSYDSVCVNETVASAIAAAGSAGSNAVCYDSDNAWAASAQLKSAGAGFWCVDSTGTSASKTAGLTENATVCPAS